MAPAHSGTESRKDDHHSSKTSRGGKHSNSSHGNSSNNGSHNDSSSTRLNVQQQQYLKDLVKRHVTNNKPTFSHNGTQDLSSYHDFDYQLRQMDYSVLRRYSRKFHLNEDKDNVTLTGVLLQSPLGLHTITSHYCTQANTRNGNNKYRVDKQKYVKRCNDHLKQQGVKEMDTISQFIYKVKYHSKDFKMTF